MVSVTVLPVGGGFSPESVRSMVDESHCRNPLPVGRLRTAPPDRDSSRFSPRRSPSGLAPSTEDENRDSASLTCSYCARYEAGNERNVAGSRCAGALGGRTVATSFDAVTGSSQGAPASSRAKSR